MIYRIAKASKGLKTGLRISESRLVTVELTIYDFFISFLLFVFIFDGLPKVTPDMVIVLTGNKADMEENRTVSEKEADEYAKDFNVLYIETSSLKLMNVKNLFKALGGFAS